MLFHTLAPPIPIATNSTAPRPTRPRLDTTRCGLRFPSSTKTREPAFRTERRARDDHPTINYCPIPSDGTRISKIFGQSFPVTSSRLVCES